VRRIVKKENTNVEEFKASYTLKAKLAMEKIEFGPQTAFVNDNKQFIAAQCSRRAGKSNGLALRFFLTMERHPKSQCIYLALTKDSAKDIMWPVLKELDETYKLDCAFQESKLIVTHPNGATLRLYGADQKNFTRRLKGQKSPGIGVDEAQDFGTHLESLLNDVLTPMMVDYADSWLAVTGTPGPVPQGYYFEITHEGKYNYSVHKWTLLDNPHLHEPEKFLSGLIERYQWEADHPTLLREWRNNWKLDVESLWIRYKESVNHYDELPQVKQWNHILGIDIGYRDSDAIAVLGYSEEVRETYLIEELVTPKQDITSLIEQIVMMQSKYSPVKTVIDQGGLGLKIAEEMRRRHSISIDPADKKLKSENVGTLNDELRIGKLKARKDSRFAQDSYLIQIDWDKTTPDKIVIKKDPHSDIIDAVLYAHKESYAFTHKPEVTKPVYGSKEWAEAQSKTMWEEELAGHLKDHESSNIFDDPYNSFVLGKK
jgi:hypothetical protein